MYIQSPDSVRQALNPIRIFLAGGITNCPVWQDEILKFIDTEKHDVVNPRRKGEIENWGDVAAEQIAWEHDAFMRVNACLFWFPSETLCPITLFELGKQLAFIGHSYADHPLIIGWHPEYKRAFDVEQQIKLEIDGNSSVAADIKYYGSGWDRFCEAVSKHYG